MAFIESSKKFSNVTVLIFQLISPVLSQFRKFIIQVSSETIRNTYLFR